MTGWHWQIYFSFFIFFFSPFSKNRCSVTNHKLNTFLSAVVESVHTCSVTPYDFWKGGGWSVFCSDDCRPDKPCSMPDFSFRSRLPSRPLSKIWSDQWIRVQLRGCLSIVAVEQLSAWMMSSWAGSIIEGTYPSAACHEEYFFFFFNLLFSCLLLN